MARSRVKTAYKTESRLKAALFYATALLVDVLIVYLIVKGFSTAYSLSYEVFSDSSVNRGDLSTVVITIPPDSSTTSVSELLYENKLIKNKYVMMAKIKLGDYGGLIQAGKYVLSPSMTYDEIIRVITHTEEKSTENSE
ncbi:MAG: endolytic transglycosylase MltG [Eubacterium sp.]|nr:endolytic transglycosylase MltG [Eubacterium sp.]